MTAYTCEYCGKYAGPTGLCGGCCVNCWIEERDRDKMRAMSDLAAILDTLERQANRAGVNGERDFARGVLYAVAQLRLLAPELTPAPEPPPPPPPAAPPEPPPIPDGV